MKKMAKLVKLLITLSFNVISLFPKKGKHGILRTSLRVFIFCHFFRLLIFILLDPSPWLVLSFEMKKEDSLKPYGRIIGFPNFVIHLSFQMQRNRSGSLMEKVALTRPWLTLSMETRLTSRSAGSRRPSSLPKWCRSTLPRWRSLTVGNQHYNYN